MTKKDEKVVSLSSRGKKSEKKDKIETEIKNISNEPVICSFCQRPNTEVVKMVKGPGVNICSECTMIAIQYLILNDRMPSEEAQKILDLFWSKV